MRAAAANLSGELFTQPPRVELTPTGRVSKSKRARAKDLRREQPIKEAIRDALNLLPGVRLEVFTPGAVKRGKWWMTPVPEGWPDLAGTINGRLLMLEVKKFDGTVRPKQKVVLERYHRLGAYCAVVRNVSEALECVRQARTGARGSGIWL